MIQVIYAAKQHPALEQLVLETAQRRLRLKKNHITSARTLEKLWRCVGPSCGPKFFFLNPNGEKCFITTEASVTSGGNEVFGPRQVSYETMNALEFSVEDELEKERDLLTRKIAKLIPVTHDRRAKNPSIPVLVKAITHVFDEKIPRSTITKLVLCRHSTVRSARNNARAAAYKAACPHKETPERESFKEFTAEQGWEQIKSRY